MQIDKSIFYDVKPLLSRNCFINFIVGGRGTGKTFGCKKFVIDDFIKNKRQFFYIRRFNTELELSLTGFFEQLTKEGLYPDYEFKVKKIQKNLFAFYVNGEIAGYACALTTSLVIKSASFPEVYNLIFDEVLLARGTSYHYLKNEQILFLELLDSIFRLRNGRCLLLSNAISVANPYYDYWNIRPKIDKRFDVYQNGLICLEQVRNQDFIETKRKSLVGRLIDGTEYGDYSINNKMLQDDGAFIAWKPAGAKIIGTLIVDNRYLGLWSDYRSGSLYINGAYNPNCKEILAFSASDHNESTFLLLKQNNYLFEKLRTAFQYGCLYFENESVKHNVLKYVIGSMY